MIKLWISLAVLAQVLAGCSTRGDDSGGFTVQSAQSRSEQADSFCAEFSLSKAQAEIFFNRGKEIDASTMHNSYDWLNCYVEGKLENKALGISACSYSIQAGGTASIDCEGGKNFLWACDSCDDLLR